jgi:hypothetical protein
LDELIEKVEEADRSDYETHERQAEQAIAQSTLSLGVSGKFAPIY